MVAPERDRRDARDRHRRPPPAAALPLAIAAPAADGAVLEPDAGVARADRQRADARAVPLFAHGRAAAAHLRRRPLPVVAARLRGVLLAANHRRQADAARPLAVADAG